MSSIRLFVLGSLADRGAMHGHALRLLAEEEHIDLWADVAASAIYGVIKRLDHEGLIEEIRTEREGNYPERSVYEITATGLKLLGTLRREGLEDIVMRPDPVDLALARLDPERLDDLAGVVSDRLERFRRRLSEGEERLDRISHHLSAMEHQVMKHAHARFRAEISWHEELLAGLPALISDEKSRKGHKS